jgi:putative peptidoglycan lipid II flippase
LHQALEDFALARLGPVRHLLTKFNPAYRRIVLTSAVVAGMTAIVMAATVARDLAIAYRFGISDIVDAFFIALLVPSIAVQVTAVALANATLPQFIRLRSASATEAAQLAANVGAIGLALFLAVTLCLAALADPLIRLLGAGFSADKAAMTHSLYLGLLPIIALQGWSTLVGALINAQQRFAIVAAAPGLRPALMIILLLVASNDPMTLVLGLVTGSLLEAVLIGATAVSLGLPIRPRWHGLDTSARTILREFGPIAASTVIMSIAQFTNQYLASLMAAGSVAALSYGGKVVALFIGLCALPLSVTILPHFSTLASNRDWSQFRRTVLHAALLLMALTVPATIVAAVFSVDIVRLLFERGAFSQSDTLLVGQIQTYLILQLPFYMLGILWVRVLTALQRNHLVAVVALVNAATNILASIIFMQLQGVAGIALAISLGYVPACLIAGYFALSLLKHRQEQQLVSSTRIP